MKNLSTQITGGYPRLVDEFDPEGRIRHSKARFEDAQAQLASNAGFAYTSIESVYDENGRLTTEWKLGCDVPTFGGPVLRVDNEMEFQRQDQANGWTGV